MLLRQLKYFAAVASTGSFTEAAEQCYISQSAISQQIQALEQELGVKLLDRTTRRPTLTPAGEYFYRKSLILTGDLERLCRETRRIADPDRPELRIGYLKGYSGPEFHLAVAEFSERFPDVPVQIMDGNQEELYHALRDNRLDLVLSDQRRAFSDEYDNLILTVRECYIEISARNPISALGSVEVGELKNVPCILMASPYQQEAERTYYREIVGIEGEFLFAENLEQARLLVMGGKGYMPVEGGEHEPEFAARLCRIRLTRNGLPIKRIYCAFRKAERADEYVIAFGDILKSMFVAAQKG